MKFIITALMMCSFFVSWTQCSGIDTINLGVDTTICTGDFLTLDAGAGYNYYSWSTNESTQTINVSNNGTYSVTAGFKGSNLVLNGDFQGGTTAAANNFTTDYIPGTGGSWGLLSTGGQYAIATNPNATHSNFSVCGDHTTGTTNMFIANGAWTANTIVWSQTVNVLPNTNYLFSFWAMNALNDQNVSQLQLYINGVPIGDTNTTLPTSCIWTEMSDIWNSASATQAVLTIRNHATAASGNDFALDDIFFGEVCFDTDEMVLTMDSISVEAGPMIQFCENEPETITATSNYGTAIFNWVGEPAGATVAPNSSGYYFVNATSPLGCVTTDSVLVNITPMPWDFDTIIMGPTSCNGNDGYVSALTNGSFPSTPVYTWTGPGTSTNSWNASVWTGLSPGWYYIDITSQGCSRQDSIEITVTNPPIANFTASPTSGYAPLNVSFTNNSQNAQDYFWDYGNGNTENTGSMIVGDQTYNVGTYTVTLVAYQGSCSDTMTVTIDAYPTIIVEPPVILDPVIVIPNVFTPNGDLSNDYYAFETENIKSLEITILNRWGNVMFQSNDLDFKWYGNNGPIMAEEGVYFYTYTAVADNGETLTGHGYIHLEK